MAKTTDLSEIARLQLVGPRVSVAASLALAYRHGGGWAVELGAAGVTGNGAPVSSDTPFDLASVTKPLVAATLARLGRQGRLGLDAPLDALLPEARGTASAAVPLELLLAHRAGLDGHRPLFAPLVAARPFERAPALRTAADARRKDAAGAPPEGGFAPVYSDLGYLLLGEAMSSACAEPLDRLLEQEVTAPLGLALGSARQWLRRQPDFVRRAAVTELVPWRGGVVRGVVHDENAWALSGHGLAGHAGVFGTAEAVARFGIAILDALSGREGGWLSRDDVTRLTRPRPGGTLRAGFDGTSGTGSAAGTRAGPRTFGHLGFTGTSLWCDPDAEVVGVILTNRVYPTRDDVRIREARPRVQDALFCAAEAARGRAPS